MAKAPRERFHRIIPVDSRVSGVSFAVHVAKHGSIYAAPADWVSQPRFRDANRSDAETGCSGTRRSVIISSARFSERVRLLRGSPYPGSRWKTFLRAIL